MKPAPVEKSLIITIDGPAGAGKTTVSKILADRLGYRYIDTGALYRGVALAVRRAGLAVEDDNALQRLCRSLDLDWIAGPAGMRLLLDGDDISDQIRDPAISMLASDVSARPPVRSYLSAVQRRLGQNKAVVLEGRDMGTVVFPQADVKFYLDADVKIRAQRRYAELSGKSGAGLSLASVENDMRRRDENDSSRNLAPLRPAADAVYIDATHLDVPAVVDLMLTYVAASLKRH